MADSEQGRINQPVDGDVGGSTATVASETLPTSTRAKTKKSRNNPTKGVTIGDLLFASLEENRKEKKSKSAVNESSKRSAVPTASKGGNPLDSSQPALHKGKSRPNSKKPSALKKSVLNERQSTTKKGAKDGEKEPSTTTEGISTESKTDGEPSAVTVSPKKIFEEKPPHSKKFRSYCDNAITPELNSVVSELITELKRLQDRLYHADKAKARLKKRVVVGFHESEKHLKLDNVKCIIIAPDLEPSSGQRSLDEKVDFVVNLCREKQVLYCFALNKRKLARLTKKSPFVSCVAVLNYHSTEKMWNSLVEERIMCQKLYEQELKNDDRHDDHEFEENLSSKVVMSTADRVVDDEE